MTDRQTRVASFVRHLSKRDGVRVDELGDLLNRTQMEHVRTALPAVHAEALSAFGKALNSQPLTARESQKLEAIVIPTLRPVFDIANGSYPELPAMWKSLNDQRARLEPIIRGVGRIDLSGHPSCTFVGTGFVASPTTILTNRHVAQIFVEGTQTGGTLSFLPAVSASLSFRQEVVPSAQLDLEITAPVLVLQEWDVALFQVAPLPASVVPLRLASKPPEDLNGGDAAIVGYPAFDSSEDFIDQATIFRSVFDKKRLQPGRTNGRALVDSFGKRVSAIAHDCSTLGGNSGSALVSVASGTVTGIHFAGETHVSNYAVPTWELADLPALRKYRLNFV